MARTTDQAYLRAEQYHDARNLEARIALHARFSTNRYGWFAWVFDQLPPGIGAILEIGCGPGTLWNANRARLDSGRRLVLSDFSPGMLAEARATLGSMAAPTDFVVADAQSLPVRTAGIGAHNGFDCVIANHMLYHVPDRQAALREIARVLAPGGCLLASTVGERHMLELDECLRVAGAPPALGAVTSGPFTIENGAEQLARVFRSVERLDQNDELVVTEVEPVIEYARSMGPIRDVPADVIERLRAMVGGAIAATGAFRISRSSGLFIARKPAR